MHAASPSTGSLILAFLGQQSCLSLALAVVLQPHCTAYPFLKSTPHKYFVKHLLANVLVLIIFFFSSLAVWKGCSLSHPSLVCGSCRYLVHVCCFEVTRALPSTLKVSSVRVVPRGGSQGRMTALPFAPCTLPSTLQTPPVPPSAPLRAAQVSKCGFLRTLTQTFLILPLPRDFLPCCPSWAPCTRRAGPALFPHHCSHIFTFASNSAVFLLISMFNLKSG